MPNRNVLITMALIVGTGLLLLVWNLELPNVRNSFVYGKTAKNIIDHGFNPLPVIADAALSHGKPMAFSVLSVPFVSILGANAGVKVASFLGTVFFLCVAYLFFERLNGRAGIDARWVPVELALLFFSPLVFYQFWSAYPDTLFAGEVLLAFILIDVIVVEHKRDTRALILLLGVTIYAAILTKFYGMILGIACPIYALLHLRSFLKHSTYVKSKIALVVVVFLVLGLALVLAKLGRNPTLDFGVDAPNSSGGGFSAYVTALTKLSGSKLISSIIILGLGLLLNFHFSLSFLVRRGGRAGWPLAPTCFAGIFVLGLLPYWGTAYNMRFFLPVFPFVVVAIVAGLLKFGGAWRRTIVIAHVGVATALVLNYNVRPVYEHFQAFNETVIDPLLDRQRRLDNLRIDQHLRFSKRILEINRVVEREAVLYWVSRYYGAATHGMIKELGVRDDIELRYALNTSEIPASEKPVYVTLRGGVAELRDRFSVSRVASGIFRLVPLVVELIRPVRDYFDPGEPVGLEASVSALGGSGALRVEFLMDGASIATDTEPPYESVWQAAAKGRHVATAKVHDSNGNVALSAPRAVFVGIPALERSIARSTDDAEELSRAWTSIASTDLDLMKDSNTRYLAVGLRFTAVRAPQGAEIKEAYLQFTTDEVSREPTALIIHAELAADAAAFTRARDSVSWRKRTLASVKWSPEPWNTIGEVSARQRTPNLSALIQEVIAQPDWQSGGAVVFIISGSGQRVAKSYDGDPADAPRLYVEWEVE